MEEVKVTIDGDGNVKVTVFGVKGQGCLQITEKLEALLGGQVQREYTSEFYAQSEEVRQKAKVEDKA